MKYLGNILGQRQHLSSTRKFYVQVTINIRCSDWLRAGRSGNRIPVGARFSAPAQTGPGAHPASCTMGTGSYPGVKSGRGVMLTPLNLLMLWSRKSIAIPLLPLWGVRPVQSLSACTRVHFTLLYPIHFLAHFYGRNAWIYKVIRNSSRHVCPSIIVYVSTH